MDYSCLFDNIALELCSWFSAKPPVAHGFRNSNLKDILSWTLIYQDVPEFGFDCTRHAAPGLSSLVFIGNATGNCLDTGSAWHTMVPVLSRPKILQLLPKIICGERPCLPSCWWSQSRKRTACLAGISLECLGSFLAFLLVIPCFLYLFSLVFCSWHKREAIAPSWNKDQT